MPQHRSPIHKAPTPIFLHSGWRVASTYFWAKFRALPNTYCYFEPLNEDLSGATSWLIDNFVPWSFARHPRLDEPYFEEFRPLIGEGFGVSGFPLELAYGSYRADRFTQLPDLRAYFLRLVEFAQNRGKAPVFGCVRTNLRVGWFKHHVPGVHLFIARDHRRQFLSYVRQAANGNPYFLERIWVILGNNRNDPAFAPLHRIIDIPAVNGPPQSRNAHYAWRARQAQANELYVIFYFLHLLSLQALTGNCDLTIDVDRMSANPRAAREVEDQIASLTHMTISLADCNIETYESQLAWSAPYFAELEAKVERLFDMFQSMPEMHDQAVGVG